MLAPQLIKREDWPRATRSQRLMDQLLESLASIVHTYANASNQSLPHPYSCQSVTRLAHASKEVVETSWRVASA